MDSNSTFKTFAIDVAEKYGYSKKLVKLLPERLLALDYQVVNKLTLEDEVEELIYFIERLKPNNLTDCVEFFKNLDSSSGPVLKRSAQPQNLAKILPRYLFKVPKSVGTEVSELARITNLLLEFKDIETCQSYLRGLVKEIYQQNN